MDTLPKSYTLNDGTTMPALGLGTAHLHDKSSIVNAILECGYTHIDTASMYKTEGIIGEALQESFAQGKKREDIYIVTKIWHNEYGDIEGHLRKALEQLQLDYVNCFLLHWPAGYLASPKVPLHKLWPEMERMVDLGLTKSIGVSNFNTQLIMDLLTYARIPPACNQIELNP